MVGYVQRDAMKSMREIAIQERERMRRESLMRDTILSRAVAPILDRMPPIRLRGFLRQSVSYPALARGLRP